MAQNHYFRYITYLVTLLICNNICAEETKQEKPLAIKLNGAIDFQMAFIKNNGNFKQQYVSAYRKGMVFDSRGHVNLEIVNMVKDIFEYGGKIGLETTGRNDRRVASHLFALSDYGKVEVGADKSAYAKMKVTGTSVAVGPGGAWDIYANLAADPSKLAYVTNFGNFLDAKARTPDKVDYSRKISYFTPKIKGLQLGVSYVPDSSNNGHNSHDYGYTAKLAKPLKTEFVIKDGIGYGISHEYKDDKFSIKSALGGEEGKIKAVTNVPKNTKFKNLRTYVIGSEVNYGKYGISLSYSNYMKSLTSKQIDILATKTYLYAVSTRYKVDKFATSLSYFFSDHKKNKVDATTIAAEYKIAEGLLPYIEVTYYAAKGKYIQNEVTKIDKSKGKVLAIGTKLVF